MPRGIGIGISPFLVSTMGRRIQIIAPDQVTSAPLLAWWKSDAGVTMVANLEESGTTPPDVTITGTLTEAQGIVVNIDSTAGGTARGQATFRWGFFDASGTMQGGETGVLTAATYGPLAGTNITLNFPAGTYNTNQSWWSNIATWEDQTANSYDVTNAQAHPTATKCRIINAAYNTNPLPTLYFDGTAKRITRNNSDFPIACAGGTNNTWQAGVLGRLGTVDATVRTLWSFGQVVSAPQMVGLQYSTAGWKLIRISDAGVTASGTSVIVPSAGDFYARASFDGTNGILNINGVDVLGGDSGVACALSTAGAATVDLFTMGAQFVSATTSAFHLGRIYEMWFHNAPLTAAENAGLLAYAMAQ